MLTVESELPITGPWQKLRKGASGHTREQTPSWWSVGYQIQVTLMGRLFWMELFKDQGRVTLRRILPSCRRMVIVFREVLRNWFVKVGGPARCKEGSHLLHATVHTHDEARLANPVLDLGLLRLYWCITIQFLNSSALGGSFGDPKMREGSDSHFFWEINVLRGQRWNGWDLCPVNVYNWCTTSAYKFRI